jgi:hypothetical protein
MRVRTIRTSRIERLKETQRVFPMRIKRLLADPQAEQERSKTRDRRYDGGTGRPRMEL